MLLSMPLPERDNGDTRPYSSRWNETRLFFPPRSFHSVLRDSSCNVTRTDEAEYHVPLRDFGATFEPSQEFHYVARSIKWISELRYFRKIFPHISLCGNVTRRIIYHCQVKKNIKFKRLVCIGIFLTLRLKISRTDWLWVVVARFLNELRVIRGEIVSRMSNIRGSRPIFTESVAPRARYRFKRLIAIFCRRRADSLTRKYDTDFISVWNGSDFVSRALAHFSLFFFFCRSSRD